MNVANLSLGKTVVEFTILTEPQSNETRHRPRSMYLVVSSIQDWQNISLSARNYLGMSCRDFLGTPDL